MPPKSKLSDKQWQEITKRILAGEKVRPLAREYGISDVAIGKRVGLHCKVIKDTAESIVEAEKKLNDLPVGLQLQTINYAVGLRAMSNNMLSAGVSSSGTSARLAELAKLMADKLNHHEGMTVEEIDEQLILLKSVVALQTTANTANIIPMNLLSINRSAAEKLIPIPVDTPKDSEEIMARIAEYDRKRGLIN